MARRQRPDRRVHLHAGKRRAKWASTCVTLSHRCSASSTPRCRRPSSTYATSSSARQRSFGNTSTADRDVSTPDRLSRLPIAPPPRPREVVRATLRRPAPTPGYCTASRPDTETETETETGSDTTTDRDCLSQAPAVLRPPDHRYGNRHRSVHPRCLGCPCPGSPDGHWRRSVRPRDRVLQLVGRISLSHRSPRSHQQSHQRWSHQRSSTAENTEGTAMPSAGAAPPAAQTAETAPLQPELLPALDFTCPAPDQGWTALPIATLFASDPVGYHLWHQTSPGTWEYWGLFKSGIEAPPALTGMRRVRHWTCGWTDHSIRTPRGRHDDADVHRTRRTLLKPQPSEATRRTLGSLIRESARGHTNVASHERRWWDD